MTGRIPTYLGDSVYVETVNGMLKLYTSNGGPAIDTIYLEPEVFRALVDYAFMQGFLIKGSES